MAFRFSTKVRNDMLGLKATCNQLVTGIHISFESGSGTDGRDRILDSDNQLGGFIPGDMICIAGSANNNRCCEIDTVAAGVIEVPASTLVAETAGAQVILGSARGGSLVDQFRNGILKIFTGTQPTSADDAETGGELLQITQDSHAFVPGSPANGLNFGEIADATLHKASGEIWSGKANATGLAGWFRIYANDVTTGASTTTARLDGSIATSGSQMNMANTSVTSGGTSTIDKAEIPMPESI